MISSLVWLLLVHTGRIDTEHAPWYIYIPVMLFEILVYFKTLPKICDYFDWRKDDKDND